MDHHRLVVLGRHVPHRVETRVIGLDERAVRVLRAESELLGYLHPLRASLERPLHLRGEFLRPPGFVDPVGAEGDEVGDTVLVGHALGKHLVELCSRAAVEVDDGAHADVVHQRDELVVGGLRRQAPGMDVKVQCRKFRAPDIGPRQPQQRDRHRRGFLARLLPARRRGDFVRHRQRRHPGGALLDRRRGLRLHRHVRRRLRAALRGGRLRDQTRHEERRAANDDTCEGGQSERQGRGEPARHSGELRGRETRAFCHVRLPAQETWHGRWPLEPGRPAGRHAVPRARRPNPRRGACRL